MSAERGPVGGPPVVWMPNVEALMLLVNLTDEGARYQPKAMSPVRRAARLRYDARRSVPAVVETGALLRDGFWLDAVSEVALAADALPKTGFSYPLSRETMEKAAAAALNFDPSEGLSRLERWLTQAADFIQREEFPEFLRTHSGAYREAVAQLEEALTGVSFTGEMEQFFGVRHRSYLNVASLLVPAGFSFGFSVSTPDGPLAFHVAGPFIGTDGKLTFTDRSQAEVSSHREFVRAFVKPVLSRRRLDTRPFADAFERARDYMKRLGYEDPMPCLEDHLVQAVEASLMAHRGERALAGALLQFDEESGFIFTRAFIEGLSHYESHRTEYRDFEAFFPTLMDLFVQLRGS